MGIDTLAASHRIQTREDAIQYIETTVKSLPEFFKLLNTPIVDRMKYKACPASIGHHSQALSHLSDDGLLIHTAQVLCSMLDMLTSVNLTKDTRAYAITAAIFHDIGKMMEYTQDKEKAVEYVKDTSWHKTTTRSRIGHITVSCGVFITTFNTLQAVSPWKDYVQAEDIIVHAILAHHGRQEWGSPVTPQDAIAWALHAADMLSAHYVWDRVQ